MSQERKPTRKRKGRTEPSAGREQNAVGYRTLFEHSPDGVVLIDTATQRPVEYNQAFVELLGYSAPEIAKLRIQDFDAAHDPDAIRARMQRILESGQDEFESRLRRKDGTVTEVYLKVHVVHLSNRPVFHIIVRDLSESRRAERALRESEARYRALLERIPDGVYRFTPDGTFRAANTALARMLGYAGPEELLMVNVGCDLFFSAEEWAATRRHLDETGGEPCTYRMRRKDGRAIWVEDHGRRVVDVDGCVCYEGVLRDISERRRLEEELARAQRLETAGRVAGQIAHDFNNLLSPLAAYPALIREELPPGHPVLELIEEMEFTANKIAEINQQLLALGRRWHYITEPIDLNDLVQKVLLAQNLPDEVEIREELCSNLLLIKGGPAQLTRALINLIVNAKEAMRAGGVLTVRTANVYLEEALRGYKTVKPGEYVKLEIQDTGFGIPEDILDKIFDPFFTTKKADRERGSGLGLSVVYNIVEDHHGYITVDSTVGQGATFTLYFPVTRELELNETVEKVEGGDEAVLIVDDDPIQRRVATELLQRLGYQTHSVRSGEEAVEYVRRHPQDLLVLDMVMEGIDGTETYRRILEFKKEQRAIVLSGYAMSQRVEEALKLGAGAFITKPVTLYVLAKAVRKELDRQKRPRRRSVERS